MRNFSIRVDYAESRGGGKRGAHSRVCGAADKGPSLDNYLPFAQA